MRATIDQRGSTAIVYLEGRISVGTDMSALGEIFREAGAGEGTHLVVSLAGVNFVDSAGLGELVALNRRVTAGGGVLVLAEARGKVKDLLELTQIGQLIPIESTVPAALLLLA